MLYFTLLLIVLILFYLIFQKMVNSFKNPQRKHESTPLELGIEFQEVQIPTKNGRALYGWLIPENIEKPTIILMHGWGRNVGRMLPYIEAFHQKGFNMLTFDARHHGSSDRDEFSTMKKFAEDIGSAVDFIDQSPSILNKSIGIIGLSIGGGAAIYAAAFDERIKKVVAVGAFANPAEIMKMQMKQHNIPYIPLGSLLMAYLQNKVGFKFDDIAPEKHILNAGARFLLIHGDQDETIPVIHARRLHAAARKGNSTLWIIPGRGHSDCHKEEDYWTKVIEFFKDL